MLRFTRPRSFQDGRTEEAVLASPAPSPALSSWLNAVAAVPRDGAVDKQSSEQEKPEASTHEAGEKHHSQDDPEPKPFENWITYPRFDHADEWDRFAQALRNHDESRVKNCNDDIDTLLVFAGLFSAVLTAFNVESYTGLQQDSSNVAVAALTQISSQLSGSPNLSFVAPSFKPPASAVRINTLWFSSLVLSLVSASLGILIKQWLREYLAGDFTSPLEWIRVQQHRYEGLVRWRVFELAALPPLLLQFALILFLVGLSDFRQATRRHCRTLAPMFSVRCPYKLPLLHNIPGMPRRLVLRLLRRKNVDS
ncbi:hypothetical protein NM688_g2022 [Phlebia brevispora]|uniref:Uncharacterized protein n=1 Tax=Phlebia brevispora TaxID=194682 RepID=A0ACC1T9P1_9APHY|nr:hypothetical protein NM688_g2022 [Phlebia brevispora]